MNYSGIGGNVTAGGNGKILGVKLGQNDLSPKNIGFHLKTIGSATGGAGAGKIKFNEFTISKVTDSASPIFFRETMGKGKGKGIPKLKLTFLKPDAHGKNIPTLVIELIDAILVGYSRGRNLPGNLKHSKTNEFEIEEIKFAFQKIEMTWTDGGISAQDDWESAA